MSALDFFSDIAERVVDLLKPDQNLRDAQWESLQDQYSSRSAFEDDLENRLHSQLVDPVVQELLIKGVSFERLNGDTVIQWPLHRVYLLDASSDSLRIDLPNFQNRHTSNEYFDTSVNASLISFIRIDDHDTHVAQVYGNSADISGSSFVGLDSQYSTATLFTGKDQWLVLQSGGDVSGGGSSIDLSGPAGDLLVAQGAGTDAVFKTIGGDATLAADGTLSLDEDYVPENSFVRNETPTGTTDGSNKIFTTNNPFKNGSECVFRNGQRLKGGEDYNVTASSEITFEEPPLTDDTLIVDYHIA